MLFMLHIRWRNGGFNIILGDTLKPGTADFLYWFVNAALLQNFAPFIATRDISMLGGRLFTMWIVWRTITNYLVFSFATSKFDEIDSILINAKIMMSFMNCCFGSIVLGCALIFGSSRKSHRWQLYSAPKTSKEIFREVFEKKTLSNRVVDFHETAADIFCTTHPLFLPHDVILPWVESLTAPATFLRTTEKVWLATRLFCPSLAVTLPALDSPICSRR